MMRFKHILLLGVAVSLLACTPVQTTRSGAVGVSRTQYMMVSAKEAEQASARQYLQVKRQAQAKGQLNSDATLLARVREITDRLIPQTTHFRDDALRWKWEVNVQKSDEINAWCMPGGKIMVYTGLADKLKLSDAELAAVLGHEIAHALREHARERMSRVYAQNIGVSVISAVAGLGRPGAELMNTAASVALQLPNSRENEQEADYVGLELAARAGYDPRAALTLWDKMAAQGKNGIEFLSTHPSDATRRAGIESRLPSVVPLYEATLASGKKHG